MEKTIVGLVETVKIKGKEVIARMDTGAEYSSIDKKLASELELGPEIKTINIRSASSKLICPNCGHKLKNTKRPVIETEIEIQDKKIVSNFNIADRNHMKYKLLIGQDILKKGFVIDPSK